LEAEDAVVAMAGGFGDDPEVLEGGEVAGKILQVGNLDG
jgi:hypothetical protein